MLCDNCIHAKHDKEFECECKLDPRVPWVMFENTNCVMFKEAD